MQLQGCIKQSFCLPVRFVVCRCRLSSRSVLIYLFEKERYDVRKSSTSLHLREILHCCPPFYISGLFLCLRLTPWRLSVDRLAAWPSLATNDHARVTRMVTGRTLRFHIMMPFEIAALFSHEVCSRGESIPQTQESWIAIPSACSWNEELGIRKQFLSQFLWFQFRFQFLQNVPKISKEWELRFF